jgi:predicted neutral ceramidase superfamily lipid hydrolase
MITILVILYVIGFLTAYTIAELEKWEIITDSPIFGRAFLFLVSTIVWPVILIGLIVCKLLEIDPEDYILVFFISLLFWPIILIALLVIYVSRVKRRNLSSSIKLKDLLKDLERK